MSSMNTKYGNGYKDGFANGKAIQNAELMHRIAELEAERAEIIASHQKQNAECERLEAENERLRNRINDLSEELVSFRRSEINKEGDQQW